MAMATWGSVKVARTVTAVSRLFSSPTATMLRSALASARPSALKQVCPQNIRISPPHTPQTRLSSTLSSSAFPRISAIDRVRSVYSSRLAATFSSSSPPARHQVRRHPHCMFTSPAPLNPSADFSRTGHPHPRRWCRCRDHRVRQGDLQLGQRSH